MLVFGDCVLDLNRFGLCRGCAVRRRPGVDGTAVVAGPGTWPRP